MSALGTPPRFEPAAEPDLEVAIAHARLAMDQLNDALYRANDIPALALDLTNGIPYIIVVAAALSADLITDLHGIIEVSLPEDPNG